MYGQKIIRFDHRFERQSDIAIKRQTDILFTQRTECITFKNGRVNRFRLQKYTPRYQMFRRTRQGL